MALIPDTDIATALATNSSGTLVSGTNLFACPVMPASDDVPTKAVFVFTVGGGVPLNYLQGGAYTPQLYNTTLRVIVRGDNGAYATARSLAYDVRTWINHRPPTGYIAAIIRQSGPMYFGQDDSGAHMFGYDLDVLYSE